MCWPLWTRPAGSPSSGGSAGNREGKGGGDLDRRGHSPAHLRVCGPRGDRTHNPRIKKVAGAHAGLWRVGPARVIRAGQEQLGGSAGSGSSHLFSAAALPVRSHEVRVRSPQLANVTRSVSASRNGRPGASGQPSPGSDIPQWQLPSDGFERCLEQFADLAVVVGVGQGCRGHLVGVLAGEQHLGRERGQTLDRASPQDVLAAGAPGSPRGLRAGPGGDVGAGRAVVAVR
jgi:hypothetical protein